MNNKPAICYPQRGLICHGGQVREHVQVCGIYDLDLLLIVSTLGRADVGTDASMAEVRAISLLRCLVQTNWYFDLSGYAL